MHVKVAIGDVVMCDAACGVVCACVCDAGSLCVVVDTMEKVGMVSAHADKWHLDGGRSVWNATDLLMPIAWYGSPDIVVIRW